MGKTITLRSRPCVAISADTEDWFYVWPADAFGIGAELQRAGGVEIESTGREQGYGRKHVSEAADGRVKLTFKSGAFFFFEKDVAVSIGKNLCAVGRHADLHKNIGSEDAPDNTRDEGGVIEYRSAPHDDCRQGVSPKYGDREWRADWPP